MEFKDGDFVEVEFDIYANNRLVQTTDEKKAKENNVNTNSFGPKTIILGKNFIIEAVDKDIIEKKSKDAQVLELECEKAYGRRRKDLIKVLPKSAFDEHQQRPVVGMTYDFNGTYGIIKSIVGGRIMVDFNNPLSGKDIKIEYKVVSKVEDIAKKVSEVLKSLLQIPDDMFKVESKEKEVTLKLPEQLVPMGDMITQSLGEFIADIKDYSVKIENFKKE